MVDDTFLPASALGCILCSGGYANTRPENAVQNSNDETRRVDARNRSLLSNFGRFR